MTGPEHYKRAESLMSDLRRAQASVMSKVSPETAAIALAEAQVHATLALVATTALTAPVCTDTEDGSGHATKADYDAWVSVAGGAAA
ncbi:hypothetical protein [Streptomyces anthocyanicus]|uniref:hypothetical protein n=1 Tax=Streptomyces anthocyanicus TaxID=68174 RepID=UPI00382DBC92